EKTLASAYPESFDPAVPLDLVFSGGKKLTDEVLVDPASSLKVTAGKLVLSPTRTYAPVIKKVLAQHRAAIHGLVHCSGGAQTKVLHFINDDIHVIKDNLFPVPPLFELIHEQSGTAWEEMYKVFNMGHRMELYVPEAIAQSIIDISKSFDIDAKIIGRVESGSQKQVTIHSDKGNFVYN
ncbi:MAG TPA: AIR synthase-related protein, partial [Pedobacter sp.]|nr:AIR synthase-related protein [Pedobacter sp.]